MFACKPKPTESNERKVVVDSVFTDKFLPKGKGFTGGDGTYSIQLPDGRTVWIFGDTFIGNVTSDFKRTKTTPAYIRNSFVTIEDSGLVTYQQGAPQEFKSMMIPPEVANGTSGMGEHELWYWPGDALLENGKLNVFVSKFYQEDHEDMWGFQFKGTELIEFSLPDFKRLRVNRFDNLDSIHFGHAIHETDSFTYIYGLKDGFPYVAKATRGNIRGAWRFYNGTNWIDSASQAAPMLKFEGSEQFSVFEWKGSFILLMQGGDLSRNIYSFTSSTPYGPWTNQQWIYETPLPEGCVDCWTYNAIAHPQYIEDDMLLVSYNTNSMKMDDHYNDALIYRPRFVRIPLEFILAR